MRISDWSSDVCSSDLASDILIHEGTRPERIPRHLEMIHESAHDALGYIKRYLEAQADSVLSRQQAGSGDVAAPLPEVLAWLSDRQRVVSGTSVSGGVGPGGRRLLKKKTKTTKQ